MAKKATIHIAMNNPPNARNRYFMIVISGNFKDKSVNKKENPDDPTQ
jgi:hypothetical protein